MLHRKFRLPASGVITFTQTIPAPFFVLKVAYNNYNYSRYGFVVSKKIDKRAVVRNRLKRSIRSCIEQSITQIKPGYDMLFILRKKSLEEKNMCEVVIKLLTDKKYMV